MEKEIISIEPDGKNTVTIQVSSECADSLYEFLKRQKVDCTKPRDEDQAFNVKADAAGNLQNKRGAFIKKITAAGTIDQLRKLTNDWKSEPN